MTTFYFTSLKNDVPLLVGSSGTLSADTSESGRMGVSVPIPPLSYRCSCTVGTGSVVKMGACGKED